MSGTVNQKRRFVAFAAATSLLLSAALILGHGSEAGPRQLDPVILKSTFSLMQAQAIKEFDVYRAVNAPNGLSVSAILRNPPANDISFIYGSCLPRTGGCAPPAEIQSWPACKRHLGLYGPDGPTLEPAEVRGVPAAFFEGGRRLEIQTGRSTIVIFARTRDEVLGFAEALQGLNVLVGPGDALPQPAPGALTGALDCPQ